MSQKRVAPKFTEAAGPGSRLHVMARYNWQIGNGELAMDDWDGFYTLTGGTAGTLIGLIFVVITLGMEHAKEGDTDRTRLFVTPILVYFATLLMIALAMVPPLSPIARALALGVIGCAGLGYVLNLAFLLRQRPDEREMLWDVLLPMVSYALVAISAAAWALEASFANIWPQRLRSRSCSSPRCARAGSSRS
jgi:hypothetical protein